MSLPTGLSQRSGVWQLRIGVPADLAHIYPGTDAHRGSLKTRDRSEAITKAHALIAQYREKFDRQRSAEVVKRAPPYVPLSAELEAYLCKHEDWLPLLLDDVIRFTPGLAEAIAPPLRFLTAADQPLSSGGPLGRWNNVSDAALTQAKEDYRNGRLDRTQAIADNALLPLGIRVDWGGQENRAALIRIARAQIRGLQEAAKRSQGEPNETPAAPVPPAIARSAPNEPPSSAPKQLKVENLKADWLAMKPRTETATKLVDRALALLKAADVDVPLSELTRGHGATFRAHLVATGIRGKSVKNLISPIQSLLNTGVDAGKLKSNPWQGLRVDTSDSVQRLPWKLEDLIKLAAVNNTRKGPERWLFPLGLYTGARIGELAQLELQDFYPVDGVPCFEIHERASEGHANRTVKTEAGKRFVPISQHLVSLGLLDHIQHLKASGERFLFPSFVQKGKRLPSELAGNYFHTVREESRVPMDERFTFHSLRHNVRSTLAAQGISLKSPRFPEPVRSRGWGTV